jgi:hypothetical protein
VTSATNGGLWKRSGVYQDMYEVRQKGSITLCLVNHSRFMEHLIDLSSFFSMQGRHWAPVIAEPFNKLKSQVRAERGCGCID